MTDGFPRLANAILGIIRSAAQQPAPDATTIREGIIASVREDGRATIRGYPDVLAPKSPTFKMAVGQRVHVAFRGPRPVLILGHNWKRAQTGRVAVGFGIEELVLVQVDPQRTPFNDPYGGWDVVFRNDQQSSRLNLQAIINADVVVGGAPNYVVDSIAGPFRVGWGQPGADNLFYVLAARKANSPPAGQGAYLPRIYLFRLSRAAGEPAGGSTVTASLVRMIDPVTWTLPSRFSLSRYILIDAGIGALGDTVARIWPYSDRCREFQPVIEGEDAVTLLGTMEVVATQHLGALEDIAPTYDLERITYLLGVRTDQSTIGWEAATSQSLRQPTVPEFRLAELPIIAGFVEQSLTLASWSLLEWTATRKRIAASWTYYRATRALDAEVVPSNYTVLHASQQGVAIETGEPSPSMLMAWVDYVHLLFAVNVPLLGDTYILGGIVGDRIVPLLYAPATPGRLLVHSGTLTAVGLDPTATLTLTAYDVAALTGWKAAELVGVSPFLQNLVRRGQAVQYLADSALYAIAEASPTGGAIWPPDAEREKFVASPARPTLTIGVALTEDPALAGRGALADMPPGIAALDPLAVSPMRIAYHFVGTP